LLLKTQNRIGGVIIRRRSWVQAQHAALRRKSKDWSARNQNNVPEWSNG
jgi:hypothetical protein